MTPTFADLAKAQYILLTTFTKDGRPKPTPIWAAVDGDRLVVMTEGDSWKVKRIRNTPRVTMATCTMRGRPTSEAVEGTAALLDKSETGAVYDANADYYTPSYGAVSTSSTRDESSTRGATRPTSTTVGCAVGRRYAGSASVASGVAAP